MIKWNAEQFNLIDAMILVQKHELNDLPRRHFQIRAKKLLALILAKNKKKI